jgi:hypothetical protein
MLQTFSMTKGKKTKNVISNDSEKSFACDKLIVKDFSLYLVRNDRRGVKDIFPTLFPAQPKRGSTSEAMLG